MQDKVDLGSVLRLGGVFSIVFSVVVGALIMFIAPLACSAVGGLSLLFLGLLFLVGLAALFAGLLLSRRSRRRLAIGSSG